MKTTFLLQNRKTVFQNCLNELYKRMLFKYQKIRRQQIRQKNAGRNINLDAYQAEHLLERQKLLELLGCIVQGGCGEQVYDLLIKVPLEAIEIPEEIRALLENGFLKIPSFSPGYLKDKNADISIEREDILMVTFLYCACAMERTVKIGESYEQRKAGFIYEANENLSVCGFEGIESLHLFELFLLHCLVHEKPFEYFLAVWKHSQN